MDLQEAICPKCGKPSPTGGICAKCRLGETPWYQCEPRVQITRCPCCGSLRDTGGWTDSIRTRDDLEYDAIGSAISIRKEVQRPDLQIKLNQYSTNRTHAQVTLSGKLFDKPVEDTCSIEIIWINESCDRCNRQHGNYWEGVVQVRADGRKATLEEQEEAQRIACSVEENMQSNGDRLSFITNFDENREGLDIIVGSQALGEQISREITRRLGGKFTLHPTLVGEKDGRKLFRITYALRLPRYRKGDVLAVRGTYGEILGADAKTYTYLDLGTGTAKTVPDNTAARHIGHIRDAEPVMVIYRDGDTIGVMNAISGVSEEVKGLTWKNIDVGEEIRIIRDEDRIIVV